MTAAVAVAPSDARELAIRSGDDDMAAGWLSASRDGRCGVRDEQRWAPLRFASDGTFWHLRGFNLDSTPLITSCMAQFLLKSLGFFELPLAFTRSRMAPCPYGVAHGGRLCQSPRPSDGR